MKILIPFIFLTLLLSFSHFETEDKKQSTQIPSNFPLTPFYLSYAEWATIHCIISTDKSAYLDKLMIALIEKSGNLRIEYKGEKMYLNPDSKKKIRFGKWENTYRNQLVTIKLEVNFDSKNISKSINGTGKLTVETEDGVFVEEGFFVANDLKY
jgi:hypothetical protein